MTTAIMTAPERSLQQRMDALERGNKIRSRRAALKQDIKCGREHPRILLAEPPEYIETMKIVDLLLAMPKYGRVKVNKTLSRCQISPVKTVGGLSSRQRTELLAILRRW